SGEGGGSRRPRGTRPLPHSPGLHPGATHPPRAFRERVPSTPTPPPTPPSARPHAWPQSASPRAPRAGLLTLLERRAQELDRGVGRQRAREGLEGTRSRNARGGRFAPGWSPGEWSSERMPRGRLDPSRARCRPTPAAELAGRLGEIERESLELDREVDVLEA